MAECWIRVAQWPADLDVARSLLRNYQGHLLAEPAGAASICLVGYEEELAELRWLEAEGGEFEGAARTAQDWKCFAEMVERAVPTPPKIGVARGRA